MQKPRQNIGYVDPVEPINNGKISPKNMTPLQRKRYEDLDFAIFLKP